MRCTPLVSIMQSYQCCFLLGVSQLTLDDYALIPGAEEDRLRELSALMVQTIPCSQGSYVLY